MQHIKDKTLLYIHGQYGSSNEAEHYQALFPEYKIIGFDYKADTLWEAEVEFTEFFERISVIYDIAGIIANSIGSTLRNRWIFWTNG